MAFLETSVAAFESSNNDETNYINKLIFIISYMLVRIKLFMQKKKKMIYY